MKKKLKVLFYLNNVFPRIGGGESHQLNIIKALNEINFIIYANSLTTQNNILKFKNNTIIKQFTKYFEWKNKILIPFNAILELLQYLNKKKSLRNEKFDILHVHGASFYSNILWLERKFKIPFYHYFNKFEFTPKLLTLHNCHPLLSDDRIIIKAYNSYIKYFSNIICVDKHIYNYVKNYCDKNKLEHNIWFIPNSVDIAKFKPERETHNEYLIVGFVGRIANTIDYELMNNLFKLRIDGVKFLLAISGKVELIKSNKNVIIYKNILINEMPQFYNKLDLLINPILHNAISLVTLEAMACGVPVMMYNFYERAKHFNKTNGITIKRNINDVIDKLNFYKKNKEILKEIGKNAREVIVENYSNDVIIPQIKKVYEEIINEH